MNFQLEEILTVIDHVKAADLALFEYQDQGARIKIRGRKEKTQKKDRAQEISQESRASWRSNEIQKQGEDEARINVISEKAGASYREQIQSAQKEESLPEVEERQAADTQTSNVKTEKQAADLYTQESPMVGTFYAAPSEDAEPFVKVGDTVKEGQTIGIIEAMKLMNEVSADCSGVVEAVMAENEQMVEYGQPLIRIRREE